jgi:hypothetical protein
MWVLSACRAQVIKLPEDTATLKRYGMTRSMPSKKKLTKLLKAIYVGDPEVPLP